MLQCRRGRIMKKVLIGIVLFLSFSGVSFASGMGEVYCPDDDEPVNLRPSLNESASNSLACGSKVEVLDTNAGYNYSSGCSRPFYQVRQGILTGYACGDFIKLNDSTSTEEWKVLCIEDDSPLGVYSDTNRTNKLTGLSCDTKVTILSKDAGADGKGTCTTSLYKIKYNNIEGYVCGKYIGSASTSSNVNIGKSTKGDNIYIKDNYNVKSSSDGTIKCYENVGDLSLRKSVGGASTGKMVHCGDEVTINSVSEASGVCPYYYNVTDSRGNSGYVCGYYVDTTKLSDKALEYYKNNSLEEYNNKLKKLGFPDSYLPYLDEIHARHPNWSFTPEVLSLTFDEVVAGENAFGLNLLQGSAFDENYFSMGLNTYDILNNRFSYYRTEEGWYDASSEAVAYYLDPRNYLNEKYIFAFEDLSYNDNHTESGVNRILTKKSYWNTIYSGSSSNVAYDIIEATKSIGISSFHIAARIEQEIAGISTSDPRSGGSFTLDGTNYSGYYNFFNIDVWGENKILRGMRYAVNHGWNSPYNGIYGGSEFIYNDYYAVNQDTLYYQKFDVSTSNGHYSHQYMQNLAVIAQETDKVFSTYINNVSEYFDKDLEFIIPVYRDMPSYTVTCPSLGNPNNYLSDLKVDGDTLNGFSYDKYEYEILVPYNTSKINISASSIVSTSRVSGIGDVTLNSDETLSKVMVVAESGNIREYSIKIIKDKKIEDNKEESSEEKKDESISIATILNNSGIKYNNDYIYGIEENTSIKSLIENITSIGSGISVKIKDGSGKDKDLSTFVTGDKVVIKSGSEERTLNIVIYGDINADGKIDKDDCLAILRNLKGYANLDGAYKVAGDANRDGKIDKDDCLAILRHLKGYTNLNK